MSRLGAISRVVRDALWRQAARPDHHVFHSAALMTPTLLAWSLWFRGVKTQANSVRVGNVLEADDGRLLAVTKAEYTQGHGRQLGNVQLQLMDVKSRAKTTARYRPADPVNLARVEDKQFNYLYREGRSVHLMEPETFEQVEVDVDLFGDQAVYLTDGLEVTASMHNGVPAACSTPLTVTLAIEETDPHMKGESATKSYKPALLSNGTTVMVPPFMKAGDLVVVNTQESTFVKRASN